MKFKIHILETKNNLRTPQITIYKYITANATLVSNCLLLGGIFTYVEHKEN